MNRSTDKKELEGFACWKRYRLEIGLKALRINSVGHHTYLVFGNAGTDVRLAHMLGRDPDFLDLLAVFDPVLRQYSVFPRLDDDELARARALPVWWPGVADGHCCIVRRRRSQC